MRSRRKQGGTYIPSEQDITNFARGFKKGFQGTARGLSALSPFLLLNPATVTYGIALQAPYAVSRAVFGSGRAKSNRYKYIKV